MSLQYYLYPAAIQKLEKSGIKTRVQELKNSEDGIPYIGGFISPKEIVDSVQDLEKKGFYEHLPKDFASKYRKTMSNIFDNPKKFSWLIQKPNDIIKEPCDLKDLLLFSGTFTSMILKPKEIWDYSKFGFSSPSEFMITVGAYITQQSRLDASLNFRKGYEWTRKRPDGSEIVTGVTGDINADLRVYQRDIASYPTVDPFGNNIEMRPEISTNRPAIMAHDFTESTMFVSVMKYIEQQNIPAEYRKDKAKQLIKWGNSLGQKGGSFEKQIPELFFSGYKYPIPKLNKENETDQRTNFWLRTTEEGSYGAYVAYNGDLVFSYQDESKMQKPKKRIDIRFLPEDAEHLIKGLIFQSAKRLGRTPVEDILNLLDYRYSSQFKKDQDRYK